MAALKELAVFNSLRLVWVLGHSSIPGNEKADLLAKQASLTRYIGPEPDLGVSSTTVQNALWQWSVLEQYRLWCVTTGCRHAKQMLGSMNFGLSKYALSLRRKDIRVLVGLLTGHAELNRHLTLMKVKSDALRPLCQEEEETSLHFLGRCIRDLMTSHSRFSCNALQWPKHPLSSNSQHYHIDDCLEDNREDY